MKLGSWTEANHENKHPNMATIQNIVLFEENFAVLLRPLPPPPLLLIFSKHLKVTSSKNVLIKKNEWKIMKYACDYDGNSQTHENVMERNKNNSEMFSFISLHESLANYFLSLPLSLLCTRSHILPFFSLYRAQWSLQIFHSLPLPAFGIDESL